MIYTEYIQYNLHYDIAAIILTAFLLIVCLSRRGYKTKIDGVLLALLTCNLVSSIADYLGSYFISNPDTVPLPLSYFMNMLFLFSHNITADVFLYYTILTIKEFDVTKAEKLTVLCTIIFNAVIIFTTPFTHLVFYFDENKVYTHGILIYALYALALLMILYSMGLFIKFRKRLTKYQLVTSIAYQLIMLIAIIVQYFLKTILIENFICTTAFLTIYMSLNNPLYYEYKTTQCYNYHAFLYSLNLKSEKKEPYSITVISFENLNYMKKVWDNDVTEKILGDVVKYFHKDFLKEDVYYIGEFHFAIFNLTDMDINKIRSHFLDSYKANDMDVSLIPLFANIHVSSFASLSAADILGMAKTAFIGDLYDDLIELDIDKYIENKNRNILLTKLLKDNFKKEKVKVYYQPIYDVSLDKYRSCEALIRVFDDDLGEIPPEEFIHLAEKNGMMVSLGEYIFDKICKFYDKESIESYGIEVVDINVSSIQCMKENLFSEYISTIYGYSLSVPTFNYDIAESIAGNNDLILKKNMQSMVNMGVKFSLDDFSMKISSDSFLAKMPFDIVKISKEDFVKAYLDSKALLLLRDTIKTIKDLNKKVFIEGVENAAMNELALSLGVDYLEGYFYAKPMSEEDFVSFLKNKNI